MPSIAGSLEEALAPIGDGATLVVPRGNGGVAMAATRALVRRGVKRLKLVAAVKNGNFGLLTRRTNPSRNREAERL